MGMLLRSRMGGGMAAGLRRGSSGPYVPPTPAADPDAPVLSNLASGWTAGDNPPDWNTAYDGIYYNGDVGDPGYGEGDQLRIRWTLGAGAEVIEAWVPYSLDLVTNGFQGSYAFYTDGSLDAGGVFTAYVDAVRDLGLPTESNIVASNAWTDTLDAFNPVNANVWVAEGDSITAGFNNYVTLIDAADATLTINNIATGGQALSHFVTQLTNASDGTQPATTLSYDAEFASILAGANDQCLYADVRDDWIVPVRAGGAKVILIAGLPQDSATVPSHAAYIATYNAAAETGFLADEFDGFVDTRLSPMSAWNATNYSDYVHPTELGQQYLRHIVEPELNRLRGIANTPIFLAGPVDVTGATASSTVTSDPFWLNGLGYGEAVAISIVGGQYRLNGGSWTSASSTAGNAMIELRGTANAAAAGTTDVVFTAGGVDATFTITTAAAAGNTMVMSATDKAAALVVSGDGLTVSLASDLQAARLVRSTIPFTGKRYVELTINTRQGVFHPMLGVCNSTASLSGAGEQSIPGNANSDGGGIGAYGSIFPSQTWQAHAAATANGDILMLAVDEPNGLIWAGKNGVWAPTGETTNTDPAAGTDGTSVGALADFYLWVGLSRIDNVTINTGGSAFAYTPPTGFTAMP